MMTADALVPHRHQAIGKHQLDTLMSAEALPPHRHQAVGNYQLDTLMVLADALVPQAPGYRHPVP